MQITNESLTQKFDKQVQCGKQVNQISVTINSIISQKLYRATSGERNFTEQIKSPIFWEAVLAIEIM